MGLNQVAADAAGYMNYLSRRQEAVASNIANADTPGYRTRDIVPPSSFGAALEQAQFSSIEVPGLQVRNDGNNVSIDRESRLLAENDLKFNLASQLVRSELRNVRSAIEEGRSA